MCPLSCSNLLIHLVTKYSLYIIYRVEGNVLGNVSNARNPPSLILDNKTYITYAYSESGTFLSTLQGLTYLILLTTLLWSGHWSTQRLNDCPRPQSNQVAQQEFEHRQCGLRKCSFNTSMLPYKRHTWWDPKSDWALIATVQMGRDEKDMELVNTALAQLKKERSALVSKDRD